ncbi:MAG: divalent-cation tolerance protein CutA [Dissulfurimicrobium sp.]|uniref:divalent-cation tolerance protein CutA n=1 Tax=Dissulfurimicrobium sp. TaxID=2022436 RepID=UPI004049860B
MKDKEDLIKIITTTEREEDARHIAEYLVERRLCACAQINGPILSIYWWNGSIHYSKEWRCDATAQAGHYEKIERAIRDIHPYETPQIIAIPVINALATYKDWVIETSRDSKVIIQEVDNKS